jgi:hypothetical protein
LLAVPSLCDVPENRAVGVAVVGKERINTGYFVRVYDLLILVAVHGRYSCSTLTIVYSLSAFAGRHCKDFAWLLAPKSMTTKVLNQRTPMVGTVLVIR